MLLRKIKSGWLVIALLLASLHATTQEQPSFRTQSNVVLVPALVRDNVGEVIYGLEAKDFIIEDDGITQNVHLDEAAESEPISLVVAIQCGRRANFELPRMHGLAVMLQPVLAQPGSKI